MQRGVMLMLLVLFTADHCRRRWKKLRHMYRRERKTKTHLRHKESLGWVARATAGHSVALWCESGIRKALEKLTPGVEDRNLSIIKVKESKTITNTHSFPLLFLNILHQILVITGRSKCQSGLGKSPNVDNTASKYSSSFNSCFRTCCFWPDLRKNQVCLLHNCSQAAKNVTAVIISYTKLEIKLI